MDNTVTVVNLWGKEGGGSKFDLLLARYYETRNTKGGRKMFCVGVGWWFCDFVREQFGPIFAAAAFGRCQYLTD